MAEINYKPVDKPSKDHPHWSLVSRIIFGFVAAIIATTFGYLLVHWWVFNSVDDVLNVSVLKSQIIANQNAKDVKSQLKDLGYEFSEDEFFQLNNPSSTAYHADVLGGYEPVEVEDGPEEDGYYFYNSEGEVLFFTVDEANNIDPDSFTPLFID